MKGLMCTTGNCEHNRNCRCLAGIVDFDKHGVCKSRCKRGGIPKQNGAAIEAAIDFEYGYSPDVLVKCECADCTYNRNRVCSCESIGKAGQILNLRLSAAPPAAPRRPLFAWGR